MSHPGLCGGADARAKNPRELHSRPGRGPKPNCQEAGPGLKPESRNEHEDKTMFAVIKTGGKQYRVAADDVVTVGKLAGEPGAAITFDTVLMVTGDEGTQ